MNAHDITKLTAKLKSGDSLRYRNKISYVFLVSVAPENPQIP